MTFPIQIPTHWRRPLVILVLLQILIVVYLYQ